MPLFDGFTVIGSFKNHLDICDSRGSRVRQCAGVLKSMFTHAVQDCKELLFRKIHFCTSLEGKGNIHLLIQALDFSRDILDAQKLLRICILISYLAVVRYHIGKKNGIGKTMSHSKLTTNLMCH